MEIKETSTKETSQTLAAASRTDWWAIALIGACAVAGSVWFTQPKLREQITPYLAGAGLGVGTAIRFGVINIKKARERLGDLAPLVEHVALLEPGQEQILKKLSPVVEGTQSLKDLPEVRSLIEQAVREAAPKIAVAPTQTDMHEKVRRLAEMQRDPADFDKVVIPSRIPEGVALELIAMGGHVIPDEVI